MGESVQVDPDDLAASGRGLVGVAETLEAVAGRVAGLCAGAGAAAGGGELSRVLEGLAREAARAVGQGAEAVDALGRGTALAGQDYRLLEEAMSGRWRLSGGAR